MQTSSLVQPFVIESSEGQRTLELRAQDADYLLAVIRAPRLESSARVSSYQPLRFSDFFAELAQHWRGWPGRKQWKSLEGELVLRAESDRTGHIALRVSLHDGAPARWSVETEIVLEAGQLERVAADARAFEVAAIHVA